MRTAMLGLLLMSTFDVVAAQALSDAQFGQVLQAIRESKAHTLVLSDAQLGQVLQTIQSSNARTLVASDAQLGQILQTIRESNVHTHTSLEEFSWVAQIVLAVAAIGAFFLAFRQIHEMRKNREDQNIAAILERTAEHNWRLSEDDHRLRVVDIAAGLQVPTDPKERKLYWATRLTHLSHVLLLQQVWILTGRHEWLPERHANWERFGTSVAKDIRGVTKTYRPKAYEQACADLWKGLHDSEETEQGFVEWLERISDTQSIKPSTIGESIIGRRLNIIREIFTSYFRSAVSLPATKQVRARGRLPR